MKLYHGFNNFERIILTHKLQSPSLSLQSPTLLTVDVSPILYIYPSLLHVAGDKDILPNRTFYLGDLIKKYESEILAFAKEYFKVEIPELTLKNLGTPLIKPKKKILEDSKEFYRNHCVFLSKEPLFSRDNFFVLDVPNNFVQQSPQGFPVVAGELSLDYVINIMAKQEQEFYITSLLEKHHKQIDVLTYI